MLKLELDKNVSSVAETKVIFEISVTFSTTYQKIVLAWHFSLKTIPYKRDENKKSPPDTESKYMLVWTKLPIRVIIRVGTRNWEYLSNKCMTSYF